MKTLVKLLIPIALLIAVAFVFTVAAVPASAQGPTPTGKTAMDPLTPTCDWVAIDPAPRQGYFTDVFYKIPYQRQTNGVIYVYSTTTNGFGFDVYDPYNASLRYLIYDEKYINWDNWAGFNAGSGTKNKYELGDLSWAGKGNDGTADSFFIVDVLNFNQSAVWYKLCYRSYYNID